MNIVNQLYHVMKSIFIKKNIRRKYLFGLSIRKKTLYIWKVFVHRKLQEMWMWGIKKLPYREPPINLDKPFE